MKILASSTLVPLGCSSNPVLVESSGLEDPQEKLKLPSTPDFFKAVQRFHCYESTFANTACMGTNANSDTSANANLATAILSNLHSIGMLQLGQGSSLNLDGLLHESNTILSSVPHASPYPGHM